MADFAGALRALSVINELLHKARPDPMQRALVRQLAEVAARPTCPLSLLSLKLLRNEDRGAPP